jgi:hypothetical protein
MFSEMMMMEKKDACYYKVKASAKVWPSAYASGRLVQCRKKGAANYGNKSESVAEAIDPNRNKAQRMIYKYFGQIYDYGDDDGLDYLDKQGDLWNQLMDKYNGEIEDIVAREPTAVLIQAAQELKGIAGDMKYELDEQGVAEGLNEFAPGSSRDNDGNDGFSDDTLRQLAAQWYNGDEDPRVEQTLAAAGWEIGQDEGYDDTPGVFVVQAGDVNGNSYISWPAHELEELAEDAVDDFLAKGGKIETGKTHKPRKAERWQGSSHIGAAGGRGSKGTVSGQAANTNPKSNKPVVSAESLGNIKMNEKYNPEYDDEAGMADNNLETLARAVEGIDDLIQSGDNLPEWCQEKIAVAKSMLVAVWDYMYSEEASDEVDPEIDAMFEAMDQLVHETAHAQQLSVDLVWESFEALDDHMLYETAAWRRKEGKSKKGGLNAKGVASYRRENPGSKLQMAVTTKPSKLKKGSKAAKRRKSFCARMSGVKGPMKKPNGKPTRKALALRKWNC